MEIANPRIKPGQRVWYRLKMTNVGGTPYALDDRFWLDQGLLESMGTATHLRIVNPNGELGRPDLYFDWGQHGEFRFWESDLSQRPPEHPPYMGERIVWFFWKRAPDWSRYIGWFARLYRHFHRDTRNAMIEIMPGQTVAATPSIVAPIRAQDPKTGGIDDARIHPGIPAEHRKDYEKLMRQQKEMVEGWGHPEIVLDPSKPHTLPYPGFRILEGYFFHRSGIYRIYAVYNTWWPLRPGSAKEEIENIERNQLTKLSAKGRAVIEKEWSQKTPAELEDIKDSRARVEEANKTAVILESNVISIEVRP